MRECAPRNVDVRGRKHHPQVVPWLNCACAELSCPPLITSPTPRAPHSTRLYPTVRRPLSFGAAGLRPVLSPHSATLQIPHLSVLQTSASPRFDLLCAHRPAKPGSETCQERRRDWVVGGEGSFQGGKFRSVPHPSAHIPSLAPGQTPGRLSQACLLLSAASQPIYQAGSTQSH